MTIKDLLIWGTQELTETARDDASRDAEYLLAYVLKTSREYVLAHPDRALRGDDAAAYKMLIDRRRAGTPVSLLTGQTWFYGFPFTVNAHVLAPRPETELVITLANERYAKEHPVTIVDVGTGSGCIAIALAKTLAEPPPIYAIDISHEALAIAKKNAEQNRADDAIHFLQGNLLEPIPHEVRQFNERKWIMANLPYLPRRLYEANTELAHEPRIALFGGDDGLDVIRGLLEMMNTLTPPWTLFMEIDPAITSALGELLNYHFPGKTPTMVCDLHGHERVCIVECV